MIQNQEKKHLIESGPQMNQMLELADMVFKAVIITMFQDWKEKEAEKWSLCIYVPTHVYTEKYNIWNEEFIG